MDCLDFLVGKCRRERGKPVRFIAFVYCVGDNENSASIQGILAERGPGSLHYVAITPEQLREWQISAGYSVPVEVSLIDHYDRTAAFRIRGLFNPRLKSCIWRRLTVGATAHKSRHHYNNNNTMHTVRHLVDTADGVFVFPSRAATVEEPEGQILARVAQDLMRHNCN